VTIIFDCAKKSFAIINFLQENASGFIIDWLPAPLEPDKFYKLEKFWLKQNSRKNAKK